MNAEQLNSARLARWSQNGEARLTPEAAAEWLNTIGFCSYLPMGHAGTSPSASFLEAVVGRPAHAPSASERSRALELLTRLIENSSAVPLKLGSFLGEQPDFVASPEALRYIYALRGERNFKGGPSTVGNEKVTALALHSWQGIEQHGPLDVAGLQPILGRDITEAAIARALHELWSGMYIFPIFSATGQPARWELFSRRFPQQVAAGANTGQAESQSAMVSLYLHAAVAAAEEEILAFLSPLAPQSKLREVLRGLGSLRQLDIIDINGRSHVCLQGGLLPEMAAQLSEEQLAASSMQPGIEIEREFQEVDPPRRPGPEGNPDDTQRFMPKKFIPRKFVPRNSAAPESRSRSTPREFASPASGSRPGASRPPRFAGSRSAGAYQPRPGNSDSRRGDGSPRFDARKTATRGLGERAKRWQKSGTDAGERSEKDRKPAGDRKPHASKSSGFRPSGSKPAGSKPWGARAGGSRGPASRGSTSRGPASRGDSSQPRTYGPRNAAAAGYGTNGRNPGERQPGERPRRWDKAAPRGAGRPGARPPYGSKPSGFTSSGFQSAGSKSAAGRASGFKPVGAKRWVSKGATSRIGSAKSYASRTSESRTSESTNSGRTVSDPSSRTGGRPFARKPWSKRPAPEAGGDAGGREKSRSRANAPSKTLSNRSSDLPFGEKRSAKPFWSKNPRGGKGSAAASRTNRPRGKKTGKKSDRKK